MSPDDPRHGTVAGYVAKCREECCRGAWRVNQRRTRARTYLARGPLTVDGTGTRRRIQALVAIGWSLGDLDRELGRKETYCSYLVRRIRPVLLTTAQEVDTLYDRLSMQRPEGWVADRQRRWAQARGWPPPLAWTDIDDPAEEPTGWQYAPTSRAEELTDLDFIGAGVSAASARLGVDRDTLERWCLRNGHGPLFSRLVARETPVRKAS